MRFAARSDGIATALRAEEIAVLSQLPHLLGAVGAERDDPAVGRMTPALYPEDAGASREFSRLTDKERGEARSADRARFVATLTSARLDAGDAAAWLRVIGEARIVLAARKGLFNSGLEDPNVSDPEVALVVFLGHLQDELATAMMSNMGSGT